MEINSKVTEANISLSFKILDTILDDMRIKIEEYKSNQEGIRRILTNGSAFYKDDPVEWYLDQQLQNQLIGQGILPPLPTANEDWDDDDSNDSGNTTLVDADAISNKDQLDENEETRDTFSFGRRYVGELTFGRQRDFLNASVDYFTQIMFDFDMALIAMGDGFYYVAVNFLQQAAEKWIKSVLLSTNRVAYFNCQNTHTIGDLAFRIPSRDYIKLWQQAKKMEDIMPMDEYFYSSLSVRTRYPPKRESLLFDHTDLPWYRFNRQAALDALEHFLKMFYISSSTLAKKLIEHFPTGEIYISCLKATIQLKGTNLRYPDDFSITYAN